MGAKARHKIDLAVKKIRLMWREFVFRLQDGYTRLVYSIGLYFVKAANDMRKEAGIMPIDIPSELIISEYHVNTVELTEKMRVEARERRRFAKPR
jgi:hypothetical protein